MNDADGFVSALSFMLESEGLSTSSVREFLLKDAVFSDKDDDIGDSTLVEFELKAGSRRRGVLSKSDLYEKG